MLFRSLKKLHDIYVAFDNNQFHRNLVHVSFDPSAKYMFATLHQNCLQHYNMNKSIRIAKLDDSLVIATTSEVLVAWQCRCRLSSPSLCSSSCHCRCRCSWLCWDNRCSSLSWCSSFSWRLELVDIGTNSRSLLNCSSSSCCWHLSTRLCSSSLPI